ncbi:hypothetical protein B0H19DRAFT_1075025 [Mycena capillaripes]|nr:hypothetical protein B0H19DRAFT_1075025 [Mycena capillaripes]
MCSYGFRNGDANGLRNGVQNGHDSCEDSKTLVEAPLTPPTASGELYSDLTTVAYLPKVHDPRKDWVASVAVPAFLAHRAEKKVQAFCSIGTGAGLDVIAAAEIFDLRHITKIQSEPEEVIGGYKKNQEDGLGPFHFYPAAVLEKTFLGLDPAEAGKQVKKIEEALLEHRIDALVTYELHRNGIIIGHTVAIVRSTPLWSRLGHQKYKHVQRTQRRIPFWAIY